MFEIGEDGGPRSRENLDPLLGDPGRSVRDVDDRADRPVREPKRDDEVVVSLGRQVAVAVTGRVHVGYGRSRQEGEGVDEVARLAEGPSTALNQVVGPVLRWDSPRTDAVYRGDRRAVR